MSAKRIIPVAPILLWLSAAAGCMTVAESPSYANTQFQVLVASETRIAASADHVLTEQEAQSEVERLLSLKPPSAAPEKLVLYEVPSSSRTKIMSAKKWLELREATSEQMKQALEQTRIFKQVEFLPEILVPADVQGDLKTLRIASARAQADVVLVYSTEAGYEQEPNAWSLFYVTIVGACFFPGTDVSSMAVSKALLLDVRTGYIHLLTETYASTSAKTQAVQVREKLEELEFTARNDSLNDLAQRVAAKVKGLKAGGALQ